MSERKPGESQDDAWIEGVLRIPLRDELGGSLRILLPGGWVGRRAWYEASVKDDTLEIRFRAADATALKTLMSSLAHTLRGVEGVEHALREE